MEIIFVLSLFLIGYTYVGYPLLLLIAKKVIPRSVDKQVFQPEITILISAFNEEKRIQKKIENSLASNYPKDKLNILVVSDGSNDQTNNIVEQFGSNVKLLAFSEQRGKAACLNDAFKTITTDIVVMTDSRQDFDKNAVIELVSNFYDEKVGAVSGELLFYSENENTFSQGVDAYWKYEKFIRSSESQVGSVVGVTGAIYALRKSLFQPIPNNTVLDDVLIPMQVSLQGGRVLFEPKAVAYDIPSSDKAREKKRKTRTIAGNYQLIQLKPELMNPFKNKLFFQLVSHKLLRLIMPICMFLMFVSNFFIAKYSWIYMVFLLGQLVFYSLVFLSSYFSQLNRFKLVKIASAFVSLNLYAVYGLKEFMFNKNIHIWK
ncbi:glycosyltransferase family 2 protein [Aliikangiella sp. IMCC44359]|uniref:glycosyltransferase family 2 protein n=1 Tax=Aliikangiella sp. IMCC44359 TaxID=3459125 RepID=UPI00403AA6EC